MAVPAPHIFNSRVTSVISISLVIFLIGVTTSLMMLSTYLSNVVKENINISIVLKEDVNDADIQKMQKIIDSRAYCKLTEFVDKDSASKELAAELGENPEEFLGFNPLSNSIEMKLNAAYANPDSINLVVTDLKRMTEVKDVIYQQILVDSVDKNIKRASAICFTLAILLMLISYALISNTVRLTIYAKRFLIHTMQLVGATKSFIRRPLILQGALTGLISSVIAMGMLSAIIYWTLPRFARFLSTEIVQTLMVSFVVMIASGLLITVIATFLSVTRYLKIKVDEMYYI